MLSRGRSYNVRGSSIAEMGPALWVLLILIVVPLIDLVSFIWGAATVMFIANNAVRQAAIQQTYSNAIDVVRRSDRRIMSLQNFAKLSPSHGQLGMDIRVLGTPTSGEAQKVYDPPAQPNKIPNNSNALANTIYQYQVTASYDVMPIFNFSQMPVLSNVPAIGKAVPVSYTANSQVEHPEGLNN